MRVLDTTYIIPPQRFRYFHVLLLTAVLLLLQIILLPACFNLFLKESNRLEGLCMGLTISILALVEFANNNILAFLKDVQGIAKHVSLSTDDRRTCVRSISLKKNSSSFKQTPDGIDAHTDSNCTMCSSGSVSPRSDLDAAATKVQKVYKSYRTRRNLADCAVVVEELWWKALDFASLKRSSVSFFNGEKPETAISRWARARTRAAKVGKGLSKSDNAQKLALQHWLEAIDPRHRYGHNLHLYYNIWFKSESAQPFFYWLDIGDGKEVNLERCPRNTLQNQSITYLGPNERKAYEVVVENGKLIYKQSQLLLNTAEGSKWIFILSTLNALYVGKKKKGKFQHSSFLSGGAITSAGRLVVKEGILKAIWPYSGHYLPTEENFKAFINFLEDSKVDLTNVKKCAVDDDVYPSSDRLSYEPEKKIKKIPMNAEDLSDTEEEEPVKADSFKLEIKTDQALVVTNNARLPCNWTTGAGPRIRCVRDYPTDLQSKALEQVNLSPRSVVAASGNKDPIPSPRPGSCARLSPRLACMGIPSPKSSQHFLYQR